MRAVWRAVKRAKDRRRQTLDLTPFASSGYNLARMRCEIELAPQAVEDLKRLKARDRAQVRDAMETHLRHEPRKTSKTRIKRLRGLSKPGYRLRVGDLRVFYDVTKRKVQVLAIVPKADADAWLSKAGESS